MSQGVGSLERFSPAHMSGPPVDRRCAHKGSSAAPG